MNKKKVVKVKGVKKTRNKYLNNKDLLAEVRESKKNGKMSDKLALMLQMLCARYAKHPWFSGYTYNEDMQAYAMLMLVKTWESFDCEKYDNPFAYYTQCIRSSFQQYKLQEKKHRTIRDKLLVDSGLLPSFTYMEEYESGGELNFDYTDHKVEDIEETEES